MKREAIPLSEALPPESVPPPATPEEPGAAGPVPPADASGAPAPDGAATGATEAAGADAPTAPPPGATPPPGGGEPPEGPGPGRQGSGAEGEPAPGVFEELRRVRAAARALVQAHVDLLKVELAGIAAEFKQIAALAGGIFAFLFYIGILVPVGLSLFFGEFLFGSMLWGVILGTLGALGVIVLLGLRIVEAPRAVVRNAAAVSFLTAVVLVVLLGANVFRQLAVAASDALRSGALASLSADWGPAIVGAVVGAVVLAIGFTLLVRRLAVGASLLVAFVFGALAGGLIGWGLAGTMFSWRGAVAIGISIGLLTWIILQLVFYARSGADPAARFLRMWPRESYEMALETRAWLEQQVAKRFRRPGRFAP